MRSPLPAGLTMRAPVMKDAARVLEVARAREELDLEAPETTLEDLEVDWSASGLDLERDAWVVEDDDGAIVAYALLAGNDATVIVHPGAAGQSVGGQLRDAVEERARERGIHVLRQFLPTANVEARALLLQNGWWPVHHYCRMRIELRNAPKPPTVLMRDFDRTRDEEEVWHLVQGAMSGQEGFLPEPLETWRASRIENDEWDPSLWLVIHDAKGLVGAALGGVGEKRTGVVEQLAVAHRAQGRGHGRTLLLTLFAAFRRRRLRFAELSVHGPTARVARLYESVGMRPSWQAERWEKFLGR